ncbi:M48 family metalloprotease [Leptolyngbyaceae cyanobacterium UHCC 1019]
MTSSQSSTNSAALTDLEAGLAAFKQEDYSTAALLLENSLAISADQPLVARAQMALAIAYERLGETDQAAQVCQQLQNSSNEQVQTWATRTLVTLIKRHPHLASLTPIPSAVEEPRVVDLDILDSSMDRSGFVPLSSPTSANPAATVSSQTGFIPIDPASEDSDEESASASVPVGSVSTSLPPISASTGAPVEQSVNLYQPTWRNAGRAKNWKPLGKVKRLQLAAVQIVTAIALFVGIQQMLYWSADSYETMWVRLLPRLGFSVVQSGSPRWTASFTAVLLLVILAGSRWILDGLLTVLYGLQPLTLPKLAGYSPETTQLLPRFCRQHGISSPALGILPTQTPIAFTYGSMPAIARIVVSQGLLDQLADDEIAAIYANELGHLANWDVPLMSMAIVILQIPYTLYRVVADWGSQKTAAVSRASASLIAAFSYGLYWLLHWIPLWLSRQRVYCSDLVATDLTGNPNGYTRALLKIAIGTAKSVQHHQQTSYLLEGFDLLMPMNHRAAVSLGSLHSHLPIEPLLQWESTNPYRHWLAINSSHPSTGDRLQLLSLYARHWQLDPELNWQSSTQKSRRSFLTGHQWRSLLLQGAPYFGIILGVLSAYLLFLIGGIGKQLNLEAISWMAGDRTLLRGLPFVGFCVGTIIRINPFFPEIRPASLKASASLSLANAIQQAPILPINSQIIRLEGRLLGRPEINNHLNQDLLLETSTGMVKLHCTSRFGFLGDLLPKATRPADLVNQTIVATGWLRRGTTAWLDVDTLRSANGRVSQSAHPVWSTVIGAIAALLGILTILSI